MHAIPVVVTLFAYVLTDARRTDVAQIAPLGCERGTCVTDDECIINEEALFAGSPAVEPLHAEFLCWMPIRGTEHSESSARGELQN